MTDYFAYVVGQDGHFIDRVDIVCDDDEEAQRQAKRLVDGHAIELWQQARKVARFEAAYVRPAQYGRER